MGLLLPCNVIVYETDEGQSMVSIIDPLFIVSVVDNESLQEVANQTRERLSRVTEKLAGL